MVSLLSDFVNAINSGSEAALTEFIGEHFVIESGTPSAAQRAQRLAGMHQNLGALTVSAFNQVDDGSVEISVMTAKDGRATLKVAVDTWTSGQAQIAPGDGRGLTVPRVRSSKCCLRGSEGRPLESSPKCRFLASL